MTDDTQKVLVEWYVTPEEMARIKANRSPRMTLFDALMVLAETHTRDDDQIGFVIMAGVGPHSPMNRHPPERYNEAWNVVREQLGMTTFPKIEK